MACKFINSLFLRNMLESEFKQTDVVIRKHHIEPVSGNVHHLSVRYTSMQTAETTLELTVLVKPERHEEDEAKQWLLLKNVLPRFADIAKDIDPAVQFAPKIILSCAQPKEALFLQNWHKNGYARSVHSDGFTLDESKVALQQLATFHATSAVYFSSPSAQQHPSFRPASLLSESHGTRNFFREALAHFIQNAAAMKIPGSVVQKLKALQPRLLAKSAEDFAASLNGFAVLNVGNATAENVVFQYRNAKPVQALHTQFGHAFCGSPIVDLMFFITTSVSYNVARNSKDELLYTYHSRLSEVLKALEFHGNIPTLLDIHLEFLRRGIFELMLTLTVAPYLRSANCEAQPKLVQPFINNVDLDLGAIAKRVLCAHAEDIIEELDKVEYNGLLDWGAESSHLKKLLRNFQ